MEVFTGSSGHTTNTEPEKVDLKLKDIQSTTPSKILTEILQNTPLPYTSAVVATVSAALTVQNIEM